MVPQDRWSKPRLLAQKFKVLRDGSETRKLQEFGSVGKKNLYFAGVAQLVEQRIRNPQVRGSSPLAGSCFPRNIKAFPEIGLVKFGEIFASLPTLCRQFVNI